MVVATIGDVACVGGLVECVFMSFGWGLEFDVAIFGYFGLTLMWCGVN